jgi:FKBP-type peptidyl-prolyl cis-trans isomerase SlyD
MQITKHAVVSFDYTLSDDAGTVLDSSEGQEPLMYLHGVGGIIPGLEKALDGHAAGDNFKVSVAPEDAYGVRNDDLEAEVSRSHFEGMDDLEKGMQFQVPQESGGHQVVTVIDIAEEVVKVDANHPLAGVSLNFDVAVREVREATDEEIEHGHAHGPHTH